MRSLETSKRIESGKIVSALLLLEAMYTLLVTAGTACHDPLEA